MKRGFILLFAIAYSMILTNYAQENIKQLEITEVYLDSKNQEVWIEIFNPEITPLTLNSLRISGIRMPNVLPAELRRKKGIVINVGDRLILCSNIQKFKEKFRDDIIIVEQKLLSNMLGGGFVSINNLDEIENPQKMIRIGDKEKSNMISNIVGDKDVLEIRTDEMSYSRNISNQNEISS